MIRGLLLGVTVPVMVVSAIHAAEIKLEDKNADGVPIVSVKGDFIERSADVINDLCAQVRKLRKAGASLRSIIDKNAGKDRASKRTNELRRKELDRVKAFQRGTRDLPYRRPTELR